MKKFYGLDKIDFSRPIYVVEGPIDSMFLDNCIATMDSALYRITTLLGDHDYIFIPDIQPRNKEIVKTIEQCIKVGKVCLLPEHLV